MGCLQQYMKFPLRLLFDKVFTIIKALGLCTISYTEKVPVYCVLYIAITCIILSATELSVTPVC